LLLVWGLLRVELLVQALITLVDDPGYRPLGAAWGVWGVAVSASLLFVVWGWRAGGVHAAQACIDLAVATGGIIVLSQLCPPGLGSDMPLLWMLPFAQGSVVALAMARIRHIAAIAGTATIIAAYLAAVSVHLSAGHLPAATTANALSFALFYAVAAAAVSMFWLLAGRASGQRLTHLAQQREMATLSERARQFRIIHDSVLQTLEALGRGYVTDPGRVRELAALEAARLRALLDAAGPNPEPAGLLTQLRCLAGEFPRLTVEIVDVDLVENSAMRTAAMPAVTDAVRELLNNITKHAACTQATVSIGTTPDGALEVVVRDHGTGFDPTRVDHGFGLRDSVIGRIVEIGGQVGIWSRPGAGTRVTLTTPALRSAARGPAALAKGTGNSAVPLPRQPHRE